MFNGCEFGQRAGRKRARAAGSLCEVLRGKVLLEENKEPVVTAGPGQAKVVLGGFREEVVLPACKTAQGNEPWEPEYTIGEGGMKKAAE